MGATLATAKDLDKIAGMVSTGSEIDKVINEIEPNIELIKYMSKGKNLFDKDAALLDSFMAANGSLNTSTSYAVSDFIKVVPNTRYVCNNVLRFYTFFDEAKNVVSGGSDNQISPNIAITTSTEAYYVRITIYKARLIEAQFEQGTSSTYFEEYSPSYLSLDRKITPSETEMFEVSKNLFNKDVAIDGFFVNWSNGSYSENIEYSASGYIAVSPDTQYVISNSGAVYLAWYDATQQFISGNQLASSPYTSPSNSKYIRITCRTSNKKLCQLEENSIQTAYSSHYKLKDDYLMASDENKWSDKKWATLGDSITAQMKWQPSVYVHYSLLLTNDGVGGATIANNGVTSMSEGTRIAAMPIDADLVSVMGGTNDWAQNIPLGLEDSANDTEFYGAVNRTIEQLLAKYPVKRIFFMTTPYGEFYDFASRSWSSADVNNAGLSTKDYADAIKNRCEFYKIPYVDIHNESGINSFNISSYVVDDGGFIHPNDIGAERISKLVINTIEKL